MTTRDNGGSRPGAETAVEDSAATETGAAETGVTETGVTETGATKTRVTGARRRLRSIVLVVIAIAGLVVVGILTVAVADAGHPAAKRLVAAQPFTLAALGDAGRQISLAGYAGQPVIVNFFASWCTPCQRETPLLARFYAAHHGRIQVIGIDSNDTTAAALKFVAAKRVGYPVAADPFPAKTATSYGVLALPQTFFLNARHQIVRHIAGQVTAKELAAWTAQLG